MRETPSDDPARGGPVWWSSFLDSRSFGRDRDLLVLQLNGDNRVEALDGLALSWAANYATTTQDDSSQRLSYFYEPGCATVVPIPAGCVPGQFPATVGSLGEGFFGANARGSWRENDVEETQWFGRLDGEYDIQVSERIRVRVNSGGWYENATRDVLSQTFRLPSGEVFITDPTAQGLGRAFFDPLGGDPPPVTNESEREIWAWDFSSKATFFERFDLLGGLRFENIFIDSKNDPFTGNTDVAGVDQIFPSRYLFFDRRDDPARVLEGPTAPAFTVFNDQILGIDVPVDFSTTRCDVFDFRTFEIDRRGCVNVDNDDYDSLINGRSTSGRSCPWSASPSGRSKGSPCEAPGRRPWRVRRSARWATTRAPSRAPTRS